MQNNPPPLKTKQASSYWDSTQEKRCALKHLRFVFCFKGPLSHRSPGRFGQPRNFDVWNARKRRRLREPSDGVVRRLTWLVCFVAGESPQLQKHRLYSTDPKEGAPVFLKKGFFSKALRTVDTFSNPTKDRKEKKKKKILKAGRLWQISKLPRGKVRRLEWRWVKT